MTDAHCDEMRLLIQADVDGELTPAEAARVGAHLDSCRACADTQEALIALSSQLRTTMPRYPASTSLATAVRSKLVEEASRTRSAPGAMRWFDHDRFPAVMRWPFNLGRFPVGWEQLTENKWLSFEKVRAFARSQKSATFASDAPRRSYALGPFPAFGGGFALATCLALVLMLPRGVEHQDIDLSEAVVSAHIRALQPGHLMDVASSDQHTVKPWFDGRLPFAPPVKDLKPVGFPLAGGRLDYLAGHTAAGLVYLHGAHEINLFVWPAGASAGTGPGRGARDGYNFERWTQNGMVFWAVTDLNARDLADFVERWRAS